MSQNVTLWSVGKGVCVCPNVCASQRTTGSQVQVHYTAIFSLAEINEMAQRSYTNPPVATLLHVSSVPGPGNEFRYQLGYVLPEGAIATEGTPFLDWEAVIAAITGISQWDGIHDA